MLRLHWVLSKHVNLESLTIVEGAEGKAGDEGPDWTGLRYYWWESKRSELGSRR